MATLRFIGDEGPTSAAQRQFQACRARGTYLCRFISNAAARNIAAVPQASMTEGGPRAVLGPLAVMRALHNTRTEAAIYWSAVSLIVCEKQSLRAAAKQLGVEADRLRRILRRRRKLRSLRPSDLLGRQTDFDGRAPFEG